MQLVGIIYLVIDAYPEYTPDPSAEVESLVETLYGYGDQNPGNDPVTAAMSRALAELIEQNPRTWETFETIADLRSDTHSRESSNSIYLANLARCAIQRHLLFDEAVVDYPRNYQTADRWREVLPEIVGNKAVAHESGFYFDMVAREVQSNKSERYKTIQLVGHACMDGEVSIVDIGCSRNHGLAHLAQVDEMPFEPLKVLGKDGDVDPELTVQINNLIRKPLIVDDSIGIDAWPMEDPLLREWVAACSFRPLELEDESQVRRYYLLESTESLPNVHFTHTRYETSVSALMDCFPSNQLTIVSAMTALYQMTSGRRKELVRQVIPRLRDNGLFIVQDGLMCCDDMPVEIDEVDFDPSHFNSKEGYGVLAARPEDGGKFYKLGSYDSGRCRQFTFANNGFAREVVKQIVDCS